MANAGRWSLFPEPESERSRQDDREDVEKVATRLLARYGVVFRRILEQEGAVPTWRELLGVYRRLESRGEVRGGRFVDGVTGEQYALPEAVARLRSLRKKPAAGVVIAVSAVDPLNFLGVWIGTERVPSIATNRLLYRDGVPIAVFESGKVKPLTDLDPAAEWEARGQLMRRKTSAAVR
jgi:ATP-dependent Lhr-like helicase